MPLPPGTTLPARRPIPICAPQGRSRMSGFARRPLCPCRQLRIYGVHKVWLQHNREGFSVGRDRLARLMRHLRLESVVRGKPIRTTLPDKATSCPFDLVNRQFHALALNMLWVSDFTHISTWSGLLRFRRFCHRRLRAPQCGMACQPEPNSTVRSRCLGAGLAQSQAYRKAHPSFCC